MSDREQPAPEMSAEDEATAAAMVNADGTMKKPYAMVYVQHSIVQFLEQESANYRGIAENENAPETDRADAKLCADLCDETAHQLKLANTAALAQAQMVKPLVVVGAMPRKLQ
jgi:hypothetical protein